MFVQRFNTALAVYLVPLSCLLCSVSATAGSAPSAGPPAMSCQRDDPSTALLDRQAMLSLASFDSEFAAAKAALSRFNPHSIKEDREYIGAIIQQGNAYRYLVARGQPGQNTVTVRLQIPRGAKLRAFWHTHGAPGPHRHLFSTQDTRLVRTSGKPFYLADPGGTIRVHRPGDRILSLSQQRRMGVFGGYGLAKGTPLAEVDSQHC